MFQAVQFVEMRHQTEPSEEVLGEFSDEIDAVGEVRAARNAFARSGSDAYAWWVVREQGATLATFIVDSRSEKEFVLDLTSGELVEVHP